MHAQCITQETTGQETQLIAGKQMKSISDETAVLTHFISIIVSKF
jgi:hypothetical protein